MTPVTRRRRFKPSPHARRRWQAWQDRPMSQRLLPPTARDEGFTVARIVPTNREPFLDVLQLLFAYGRLCHHPGGFPESLQSAWQAWLDHTQTLTAVLTSQEVSR